MSAFIIVLTVIDAMVALLLIGVVLIQQSKDGGLGGAAFGGAGASVFGGQAADHLAKITVYLSSIFLILTLSLAIITGRRTTDERLVDEDVPAALAPVPAPEKVDAQKVDKEIINVIDGKDVKAEVPAKVEKKVIDVKKDIKSAPEVPAAPKTTK